MKLNPILIAVALCCLGAARADEVRRPYIVQLSDKPLSSYAGGVAGIQATRPGPGQQLDLNAPQVQLYSQYLAGKQASVLSLLAAAPVHYQYQLALNGFAAMLTDDEVRQLKARSDVAAISADAPRHVITNYTASFLGLDQPAGLWNQLGGRKLAGENIVIGVLDTGVVPEHLSYSDRADTAGVPTWDSGATLAYDAPPPRWRGACASGPGFDASHCNNKLVGAQFFASGFLARYPLYWSEFLSPRDANGHGTHTSTTAGGNAGVPADYRGVPMAANAGMAPRARLAMYKVCWTGEYLGDPIDGCFASDSVAAVEQAIRDGVDVLNYSISGGGTLDDPVEQAFLHASDAGIFVAAAAGNAGPLHYTLSHLAPWLTTVAATNHDSQLRSSLSLGNGKLYRSPSLIRAALPPGAMILAEEAAMPGVSQSNARLCYETDVDGRALLDPAKVKGKVVVCRRGFNEQLSPLGIHEIADQSLAVQRAGALAVVLVDDGNGPLPDAYPLPTLHVGYEDGMVISDYARGGRGTAAMGAVATVVGLAAAPVVTQFSSRGPNQIDLNVLKPDLAAPGADILSGVAPWLTGEQHDQVAAGTLKSPTPWDFWSGTSMASPHVAGVAALLRQQHPDWSPAAIKSALMTSTRAALPDAYAGTNNSKLPWAQGAGQIAPNSAANPGLVYQLDAADYARYLCGAGLAAHCGGGSTPGYNLNLASITANNVAAALTVSRKVTNVGASVATYRASAALPGYEVTVAPSTLTLAPGESAGFTVALKRTTAPDDTWQYGALVWSDGSHTVTSPLQATPGRLIDAPSPLLAEKASGMRALSVYTSYSGKLATSIGGMKPVSRATYDVAQAPANSVDTREQIAAACQAGRAGVRVIPVTLPANTLAARFELFDRDTGDGGGHDLDLAVLDAGGKLLQLSNLQGSDESVTLTKIAPGGYRVCVVGSWIDHGRGTSFALSSAIVTTADNNGTLKATLPTKVYQGAYATVGVSWSGLAAQQRYFGAIQFADAAGTPGGVTTVGIDTGNPVPLAPPLDKPARRPRSAPAH